MSNELIQDRILITIPELGFTRPFIQNSHCLFQGNEDASSALGGAEEGKLWGEREISLCMSFPFVLQNFLAGLGVK